MEKEQDIFKILCKIGDNLASTMDLDELLTRIMEGAKQICNVEADSILLMDKERDELYFRIVLGEKCGEIKRVSIPLGEGIAGWVARNGQPLVVNNVDTDVRFSKRMDNLTGFRTKSVLCVPIQYQEEILGAIEVLNKSEGKEFTDIDLQNITILASQSAVALNNAQIMNNLHNFFINTIEILVMAIEALEPLNKGHSVRVARLSTSIARQLMFNKNDYEDLYYAALIHDIGKLKTEEPKHLHPVIGAEMVKPIKLFERTAPLIRYHHELFNGKGYPEGLKGEDIPLSAGILSIAEDFEDKIFNLGIKDRSLFEKTKDTFLIEANGRFNPEIVSAFREVPTDIYDFLNL